MEFVLKELKNAISLGRIANVHYFEFNKNHSTKDDSHPFCEIVFTASGKLSVSSEKYTGQLSKNEMILHPENTRHSLSCSAKSAPSVIIIGFECISPELIFLSNAPTKLSSDDVRLLAEIVKEGRRVFEPPYDKPTYNMKKKKNLIFGSEQMLKTLIEQFLISVVRKYGTEKGKEKSEAQKGAPAMREIIDYVDSNFLEKITIDELAFLFNTNRATLCKDFKTATGKTLIGYIAEKKIALAKDRILNSDMTFTRISEELHFDSVHYFTRFFKKHTGVTPKTFRTEFR